MSSKTCFADLRIRAVGQFPVTALIVQVPRQFASTSRTRLEDNFRVADDLPRIGIMSHCSLEGARAVRNCRGVFTSHNLQSRVASSAVPCGQIYLTESSPDERLLAKTTTDGEKARCAKIFVAFISSLRILAGTKSCLRGGITTGGDDE
jgi:hypothetical protein